MNMSFIVAEVVKVGPRYARELEQREEERAAGIQVRSHLCNSLR